MVIRFTEFMKQGEKDISLYIVQDADQLSYHVFIFGENSRVEVILKKEGNNWMTAPQNIPVWVTNLTPVIGSAIEHRLSFDIS